MKDVSRETGQARWLTDRGLMIASGPQTLGLYKRLAEAGLPGVTELVPADGSLLVVLERAGTLPGGLQNILDSHRVGVDTEAGRQHDVAVRFDGEDLDEVAEKAGLSRAALIDLVCAQSLNVKFLGFQPGFAYLDGLSEALHMPRLAVPRKRVPKGSVALGGGYCGIYPAAGPGGWHLIGTTDMKLFNHETLPPSLLQPGDKVRLVAA